MSRDSLLLVAIVFAGLAGAIYAPAVDGPFVSDDHHYVVANPYVTGLSWERFPELWEPRGEATRVVENYAPLNVLLHGLEWRAFGERTRGYHLVNVAIHVLVATILVVLFRRWGIPDLAAIAGGALFLVHPANVEAVAWISQLKTNASTLLAVLALLALPRRPALAAAAFVAGLLVKPMAAFALPVAAVALFVQWQTLPAEKRRQQAIWLGVWSLLFLLFALVEMGAFLRATSADRARLPELAQRGETMLYVLGRYAVMAVSSWGVSAFHAAPELGSLRQPWALLGAGVLLGSAVRAFIALRRRSTEAIWWAWAAVSFLPVSQLLPFRYPVGDHYLYPILPGLIGVVALLASQAVERLPRASQANAQKAVGGVLVIGLLVLGVRAHGRAELWQSPLRLVADSAAHYPDGIQAHLMAARRAAQRGDAASAAAALRRALDRGYNRFEQVLADPTFARMQSDPDLQRVFRDMALQWIERYQAAGELSQAELYSLGVAHQLRGERAEAQRAFQRALDLGGPLDPVELRRALAAVGGS